MIRPIRWLLCLAASGLLGCAAQTSGVKPTNSLDQALRYDEVTRGGSRVALSGRADSVRVPNGAEVDVNSTIEISLCKETVTWPTAPAAAGNGVYSAEKAAEVKAALDSMAAVIAVREQTVRAYQKVEAVPLPARRSSPEFQEFLKALHASASASFRVDRLPLWTDGTISTSPAAIDSAFRDYTFRRFTRLLQKELDSMTSSVNATSNQIKTDAPTLQMTAFIQSPGSDPTAIHLPNYDSLDERTATFTSVGGHPGALFFGPAI